jgi:hypothetical protein
MDSFILRDLLRGFPLAEMAADSGSLFHAFVFILLLADERFDGFERFEWATVT